MALQKGDFIKINYTGKLEDGRIFDTTIEELAKENNVYSPQGLYGGDVIVIGCGHTIAGLDEDFVGKNVGDENTLSIPEDKAFGPTDPKLVTSVSTSKFKEGRASPGMVIEQDGRQGVVTKVIGRRATIDFNSPLAGKTVTYSYKIDAQITDTAEKVQRLFAFYTGIQEGDVEIDGTVARITVPPGITFNQRWLMTKGKFARELTENTDLTEIQFVEKYPKEEKKKEEQTAE